MNIKEVRSKYPQYEDLTDAELADGLYRQFYSDMPRGEFNKKLGLTETRTHRQAEDAGMERLQANPPTIERPSEIERLTGGYIGRPAFMAAGGAVGAGLAIPTGPIGMAAASALGTAGGSLGYDLAETIARRVQGKTVPQEQQGMEPTKTALGEAAIDTAFSGGLPLVGGAIKRVTGKALGLMTPEARQTADLAESMGVKLGAAHVSPRAMVKGAPKVLGVFPFAGSPLREGQKRIVGQLDVKAAQILNELAPTYSGQEVGKRLTEAATAKYNKFDKVASSLYEDFYKTADALPVKEIISTAPVKATVQEIAEKEGKSVIKSADGKVIGKFKDDPVGAFISSLSELPEKITVEQARGLERELNQTIARATSEGFDISRLGSIKKAIQGTKNALDVSSLPKEMGDDVISKWNRANEFFHQTRQRFETATAKKFGRVDKNIFGHGVFKAGTINEDEVFNATFRAQSPEALDDLRKLVGPQKFNEASRKYLDNALKSSIKTAKEGDIVPSLFSAREFENAIGLSTPEGRKTLETMLKGTKLSIRDLDEFASVAKEATDISIRDPSTFMARRIVLTGIGAGMAGALMMGAGQISIPAAALVTWVTRQGSKFLMDADNLKAMTRVMDINTTDYARRMNLMRLINQSLRGKGTTKEKSGVESE